MTWEEIKQLKPGDKFTLTSSNEYIFDSISNGIIYTYYYTHIGSKYSAQFTIQYVSKVGKIINKNNMNFKEFWKPGNIITTKNNNRFYITTEETAVGLNESIEIKDYCPNGENKSDSHYDIISISNHFSTSYGLGWSWNLNPINSDSDYEILWDNNKIIELTVEELEKKLGMSPGSLRIKK